MRRDIQTNADYLTTLLFPKMGFDPHVLSSAAGMVEINKAHKKEYFIRCHRLHNELMHLRYDARNMSADRELSVLDEIRRKVDAL